MRMLLKWELGLHATNEAIRSGKMAAINEWLNECLKPEAAYFGTENGKRTGHLLRPR
jgi:hypothetical protein